MKTNIIFALFTAFVLKDPKEKACNSELVKEVIK